MGKIVVPNIYMDIDLLRVVIMNCDPISRVVITFGGIAI